MTTHKIERKDLSNLIAQMDLSLSNIEVKGDSVKHLFDARLILRNLFESMILVEEKEEST